MGHMKCKKCDNDLFKIDGKDCNDCEFNGAYDEEDGEYIYDEAVIKSKNLMRTESNHEGQCKFGHSYDNGCFIFTCSSCGNKENIPLIEE
jgi:DNA-directed RNA polymerase subunit M/transcription elongation factor TFIIS